MVKESDRPVSLDGVILHPGTNYKYIFGLSLTSSAIHFTSPFSGFPFPFSAHPLPLFDY